MLLVFPATRKSVLETVKLYKLFRKGKAWKKLYFLL